MPRIYLSPPHVGREERELLLEAFDSNWIAPLGPHVDAFERELGAIVGVAHVAALSSGSAALHLALLLSGVERGDVVIVSTLTFAASCNPIIYLGATPVFIDCESESWNLDPDLLEAELMAAAGRGDLPKAVVAVDLYGRCADYGRIVPICERYGVPLIEDAAEALGARQRGRGAGSFGSMGVLSFNGNKIITTSGGGALVSNDAAVVQRARFLATQARDQAPHYEHSEIGYNYRLSNLLAAIGRGQLQHLDHRIARRRANYDYYSSHLGSIPGITMMPRAPEGETNYWLTCILVDPETFGATREDIRLALEAEDIESRPIWKPMHLQPAFRDYRIRGGEVSERIFNDGLCLPSGSSLAQSDLERIVEIVKAASRSISAAPVAAS
jgi:pyridoxal phosphate-dependent aminotransferase EpsN